MPSPVTLARLYAHRATDDELDGLTTACADDERVMLAYVDLDGMKGVNDTHGHRLGDAVLIVVAQRMARVAQPGELVARLGGDEFAVLSRCRAVRIRPPPLTASVGASSWPCPLRTDTRRSTRASR